MVGLFLVLCLVAGVLSLVAGIKDVRRLLLIRRSGLRVSGVVTRYAVLRSDSDGVLRAPVVEFVDEHGVRRQFTSDLSSTGRPSRELGAPVAVAYLPGRPDTARIHTGGQIAMGLLLTFGIALAFFAGAAALTFTA